MGMGMGSDSCFRFGGGDFEARWVGRGLGLFGAFDLQLDLAHDESETWVVILSTLVEEPALFGGFAPPEGVAKAAAAPERFDHQGEHAAGGGVIEVEAANQTVGAGVEEGGTGEGGELVVLAEVPGEFGLTEEVAGTMERIGFDEVFEYGL